MVSAYHVGHVGVCVGDGPPCSARTSSATLEKNDAKLHAGQPEGLQGLARVGVPLSIREIRRLFWRLVLATQPRVERMLAWSVWRRWHQGSAQYWHYKRRAVP